MSKVSLLQYNCYNSSALCAEISQSVIENIDGAIEWLRNTFFYLRARQNPTFYGFSASLSRDQLDQQLNQLTIRFFDPQK